MVLRVRQPAEVECSLSAVKAGVGTRVESTTSNLQLSPPAQDGSPRLRLDVWEKGNISIVQLEEKLRAAARQALADAIMELRLLPASLCTEDIPPGMLNSYAESRESQKSRQNHAVDKDADMRFRERNKSPSPCLCILRVRQ